MSLGYKLKKPQFLTVALWRIAEMSNFFEPDLKNTIEFCFKTLKFINHSKQ